VVVINTSVTLAGRYRLEGRIAFGGVGEVWRAVDLVLGRPVAVKLLRAEYAEHPEVLTRFRAEARHAGSVSHPGIAQVYDFGETGAADSPYLVMELVDGPSLARVLSAGPLNPADTMDVLAQAAAGLQAAHAAGLVHRDIKPGNLLVGPVGQVKITDFGIAYAAWSAPITQTGALVGTPAYLAPERVAGGPATPASDLYALGVVGYQCLTGEAPFGGMPPGVAAAHQQRTLPPLPRAVPPGVAGLILELTARDPAARPGSAGEVATRARRLRDALTGDAAAQPAHELSAGRMGGEPVTQPAHELSAGRMGGEPVTLAGGPATLAGEPLTMPGGPVTQAWRPAPARMPTHPRPPGDRMRPRRARMRPRQDRMRPGRGAVLAMAGAAAVAGLVVWLVAGAFGAGSPPRPPGAAQPAARPSSVPATRTVEVNAAALAGHRASAVSQRLRQLGLRPRVVRAVRGGRAPGTVISVRPSGHVPAGSRVTVTAVRPPGHRHSQGNSNRNGNGNGQGNDGGD
jgi:eukaryotic-like serine/threonine-protein kinase